MPASFDSQRSDWQRISRAPFDRDLQLAVIDGQGVHALVFACRRVLGGWVDAETLQPVPIEPTHWRDWIPQDWRA